ncbi:rRNA biogenesis protein RRP36 [Entamoeba marina]
MPKNKQPQEISAKKRVSRHVEIIKPKKNSLDPRFSRGGKVSMLQFAKKYSFLKGQQEMELSEINKQIKQSKGEEKEMLIKKRQRLAQRLTMQKKYESQELVKRKAENQNQRRIVNGKNPKFISKKEFKDMVDHKAFGNELDKVKEKRHKRHESKLIKHIPNGRK